MDPARLSKAEQVFFEAVRCAADPASIAVFGATTLAFMDRAMRRAFQHAVWQRYREWTQPGTPDGPPFTRPS